MFFGIHAYNGSLRNLTDEDCDYLPFIRMNINYSKMCDEICDLTANAQNAISFNMGEMLPGDITDILKSAIGLVLMVLQR